MEQDRKQFLHFSWNIEKSKEKIKESCLHAGKYNASLIENNRTISWLETRLGLWLFLRHACYCFQECPRTRCDTNKFKFACLVCTICRFDSRSSCSLFVHSLTRRIELAFAFTSDTREKSLCVPHTGVATAIKGIEQNVLWLKNTSNQIAFYLHLLWFCVVSFCLFSSPLQDPSDLRCRGFYVSL